MTLKQDSSEEIFGIPLVELRRRWQEAWGIKPHNRIGRKMLEKSLAFKLRELNGQGLTQEQQEKLNKLVMAYKKNPRCFDDRIGIKAGVRLVRVFKGVRYSVIVKSDGFEYNGKIYGSLSRVAKEITGITYNGWAFFHLKRKKK